MVFGPSLLTSLRTTIVLNRFRPGSVTMLKRAAKPSAHIGLIPARPEQESILANLLELYAYDFSEFNDLELGVDGRFGYGSLALYWTEPGRHPFLVWVEGKLAGLVLVKRGSEVSGNAEVWDVAEFFVLRGCRRLGIGTQIASEVWRRFPGLWEVRVMESNVPALDFWAHAISIFAGEAIRPVRVEKDGKYWALFSFESKRVA
jgi:predicted acetyltransferase